MIILNFIKMSFINLFSLVGGFIGFGLVFDWIERLNNKFIFSSFGKNGMIITGFIGTVIHELSHATMCLIFGHKITSIKLFRPIEGQIDGVLGYVAHSYNKKNIFQTIGNFFIAIAPLMGGTMTMIILFRFLLPTSFSKVIEHIDFKKYVTTIEEFNIVRLLKLFINDASFVLKEIIFSKEGFSIRKILFLFSIYSISTHMRLSKLDLKSSVSGLGVIALVVVIVTFISIILGVKIPILTTFLVKYNIFITLFMFIGLFFSLFTLIISFLFNLVL